MPTIRLRVVCGFSETIETFCPRMRLRSVDLPALGRPTSATTPNRGLRGRKSAFGLMMGGLAMVVALAWFALRVALTWLLGCCVAGLLGGTVQPSNPATQ